MDLTLEIIGSYGFKMNVTKPDWDDVQHNYTLKNGLELSCLVVCCNDPVTSISLEGLDGFICIKTKEELDELIGKTYVQICKEVAEENADFDISEWI